MVTVLLSPLAKVGYQGDSEDGLFLVDLYWEVSHTPHVSAKVIAIDSAGKTYERVMTVPIYDPPTCPAATPWQGFTGDGGGFCTMYFHLGTAHPVKVRMVLAAGVGDTVAWTGPF